MPITHKSEQMHGTTVLCVRKDNKVVLTADGQVTLGDGVIKHSARKTRRIYNDKIIAGFAGSTADALSQRERIGGAASEARDDFVVVDAASLARAVLDHAVAQSDLAVGGEHDFIVFAHAQHRGAVHLFAFVRDWHPTIIPRRCANGPPRPGGAGIQSKAPQRHREKLKNYYRGHREKARAQSKRETSFGRIEAKRPPQDHD